MPDCRRDVGERAVAVVPVEDVGEGLVRVRVAVRPVALLRGPAHLVLPEAPHAVVDDEEVQVAVAVVVEEARARPTSTLPSPGPLAGHPGGGGHVLEGPVAPVPVEDVPVDARHVEVGPAVVVEIARGGSHRVAGARDPGPGGDVLEHEPGAVAVEPIREAPVALLQPRDRRPVAEEDVQAAVVVEVEERDPRDHGLDLVPLGRLGVADDVADAGPPGDVLEPDLGRGGRSDRQAGRQQEGPSRGPCSHGALSALVRLSDSLMCSSPQSRSPCS